MRVRFPPRAQKNKPKVIFVLGRNSTPQEYFRNRKGEIYKILSKKRHLLILDFYDVV